MSVKVTNEAIKNLLANAGEPLTSKEIIDALGYQYEDIHEVSARLRGMEKRPKQRVAAVSKDGHKCWFLHPEEGDAARPVSLTNRARQAVSS